MTPADTAKHAAAGTLAAACIREPRDGEPYAYFTDRAWLGVLALESAPRPHARKGE